jgi:hypothetical protein
VRHLPCTIQATNFSGTPVLTVSELEPPELSQGSGCTAYSSSRCLTNQVTASSVAVHAPFPPNSRLPCTSLGYCHTLGSGVPDFQTEDTKSAQHAAASHMMHPVTLHKSTHHIPFASTPHNTAAALSYLGGGGGARRAVDGVEGTPLGVPPGLAGAVGARLAGAPDKEVRARPAWPSTSPCSMKTQPQHTHSATSQQEATHQL